MLVASWGILLATGAIGVTFSVPAISSFSLEIFVPALALFLLAAGTNWTDWL